MGLLTYTLLLSFVNIILGKDCIINNTPEHIKWEKQLKTYIRRDYYVHEPPCRNNSIVSVNVSFSMKYFNFDNEEKKFSVQNWMFVTWTDERLKWDPENFHGIKAIEMYSFKIWTPSFRLYNSANSNDYDRLIYALCHVKNTGAILCVPRTTHDVWCNVRHTNWPYDVQECSLEFGAWTNRWDHLKLNITSRGCTMLGAEYGAEWFISDYKEVQDHNSERQLKMTFVLEREATGLAALVVYPALILSALSMTCLFLDLQRRVRLGVACFSLLGHYYFLTEVAWAMPKQTASPPTILLYYRSSVIITVIIVLSTFLLAALCKWKSTPQNFILSINEFVYESYGRYLVFPRWDMDDDPDDKRISEDWTKFANIVNSVFAFIILITYISLYSSMVPKPVPVNY